MDPETHRLLYTDESGEVVGLDEVQILESADERVKRTTALRKLLDGGNIGEQLDSLLILSAWGDKFAIQRALELLNEDVNPYDGINTHRLHGADRTYDLLADALSRAARYELVDPASLFPHARRIIEVSANTFVENGLERLLTELSAAEFLAPTNDLLEHKISSNLWAEASDLLPAIAAMDKSAGWNALHQFGLGGEYLPKTIWSAIRALGRIRTSEALDELERIRSTSDSSIQQSVDFTLNYGT